eukprot:jgi/Picre1/27037/NNA_000007.t1
MLIKRSRSVLRAFAQSYALLFFFLILSIWRIIVSNELIRPNREHRSVEITLVSGLYQLLKEGEYEQCTKSHSQFTAVTQWSLQFEEVLILADDWSVCIAALLIGKQANGNIKCHQHTCMHPEYGRPTVPCLLKDAITLTTTDYILFTNSDLVYLNVVPAIDMVQGAFKENFALLGRRRDIDFQRECKMTSRKESFMSERILSAPGKLHDPYGIDYIVFPRNALTSVIQDMPDFLIGLWKWDNWIVDTCIHKGVNLVDATNVLHAIHLQSTKEDHRGRKGFDHNRDLYSAYYKLGPDKHLLDDPFPVGLGTIDFAPFYIKNGTLLRRWCYFDVGKEFQPCSKP